MSSEDTKILDFNQNLKADEIQYKIYAHLKSVIKIKNWV